MRRAKIVSMYCLVISPPLSSSPRRRGSMVKPEIHSHLNIHSQNYLSLKMDSRFCGNDGMGGRCSPA